MERMHFQYLSLTLRLQYCFRQKIWKFRVTFQHLYYIIKFLTQMLKLLFHKNWLPLFISEKFESEILLVQKKDPDCKRSYLLTLPIYNF